MNNADLDNREWFIAGIKTAIKTDELILALINGENKLASDTKSYLESSTV